MMAEARQLLVSSTADSVRLYHALNDDLADQSLKKGQLVPKPKSRIVVSPSFVWIGYRSGWATKKNQERVLALDITHSKFESILNLIEAKKGADIIPQWDPSREIGGKSRKDGFTKKSADKFRCLQLGIKGEALEKFKAEAKVIDLTSEFKKVGSLLPKGKQKEAIAMAPEEKEYKKLSADVMSKLLPAQRQKPRGGGEKRTKSSKGEEAYGNSKTPSFQPRVGDKVLAIYEGEYYPAEVFQVSKRSARVIFEGYEGKYNVNESKILTKAQLSFFARSSGSSDITPSTKVFAVRPKDDSWHPAQVQKRDPKSSALIVSFGSGTEPIVCPRENVVSQEFVLSKASLGEQKGGKGGGNMRKIDAPKEASMKKGAGYQTPKEGSTNFYLSLDPDNKVVDMLNPILCLYKCGVPARYGGRGGYPMGEILTLVHTSSSQGCVQAPYWVKKIIAQSCFKNTNAAKFAYEFVWLVSDVSGIAKAPDGCINMVHHAWVHLDVFPGQRKFSNTPVGGFNLREEKWNGRLTKPLKQGKGDRDLPLNRIASHRVSVHGQGGAMACSPNNAKIYFDTKQPLIAFWSAAIDNSPSKPRVLIQLNWLFTKSNATNGYQAIIQQSKTLEDLLGNLLKDTKIEKDIGGRTPLDVLGRTFTESKDTKN